MVEKILAWLHGDIKTPPFSSQAGLRAGFLLREVQSGSLLGMPDSRPMPSLGKNCHELRVVDSETNKTWRIFYRIDFDAIVIIEVLAKKTQKTPQKTIDICKKRLKAYDQLYKD